MKKSILIRVIGTWMALSIATSCNSGPPIVNPALNGIVAKVVLDDMSKKVSAHMGRAESIADFALEKAATEAQILLQEAHYRLERSIDRVFENLSRENQKLLDTVEKVVASLDSGVGRIEDLEDLLAIDVSNSMNRLWFTPDEYYLRRIKGWAIPYQSSGAYTVELVGGALGPDYWAKVVCAGHEVPGADLLSTRAGFLNVRIPAEKVNSQFSDSSAERVELQIECGKKGDKDVIYSYSGHLVLMPRLPYEYSLVEHHVEDYWSGKQDGFKWGSWTSLSPTYTNASGEEPSTSGSASVEVSPGERVIAASFKAQMDGGGWGRFINGTQKVTGGGSGMSGDFKNWKNEGQRARVGVGYETKLTRNADTALKLANMNGDEIGAIPFGTSQAILLPGYQSFTLTLKSFTGKEEVFTPGRMVSGPIELTLEDKEQFKRLIVEVSPPR